MAIAARAQQAGKIPRIGFIGNSTAALEANLIGPFRDGLRELGYEEGRNLIIEFRWAEGKYDRFPALIAELLAVKVDVIVTAGTPATLAIKKATSTVPLVFIAVGDPVGTGIVPSLARPGGNITGLSSISPDLEGKRLELLREVVPKLAHVAVFLNPANAFHTVSMRQVRVAATIMLPFVLPGLVIGVAYLTAFNSGPLVLTGTALILVLAYFTRRVAFVFRTVAAAIAQIDPKLEFCQLTPRTADYRVLLTTTERITVPRLRVPRGRNRGM